MDDAERERFREALDRKAERARGASPNAPEKPEEESEHHEAPIEPDLIAPGNPAEVLSVRDKSSGHGKKTADKWNQ